MTQKQLTREQVLGVDPGPDLNVMVAEHIFRWRRIPGPKHDYDGPVEHGEVLVPPNMSKSYAYNMMPPRGNISLSYFINRNWSKDISAAWEVFKYFKNLGVWIEVAWNPRKKHARCLIGANDVPGIKSVDITSETEELALCRAAILAVLDL